MNPFHTCFAPEAADVHLALGQRIAAAQVNKDWAVGEAIIASLLLEGNRKSLVFKSFDEDEGESTEDETLTQLFDNATACDENYLVVYGPSGARLGMLYLIPGNGADTICDYTVNPHIEALVNAVQLLFPS